MSLADCTFWEYQISLAADGELAPEAIAQMNRHLDECAHCRSVRESFAKCAQALRNLPELAGPGLLAEMKREVRQKVHRRRRLFPRLLGSVAAAAVVAVFTGANLWLGPLWQRPVLLAAAAAPDNRLELTFNQSMDTGTWTGTALLHESTYQPLTAGPAIGAHAPASITPKSTARPDNAPRAALEAPGKRSSAPGRTQTRTSVPPYTVTRQGRTVTVTFAGPLPRGPVQILVPATLRDRWGRELGRAYLIVVDQGKITVKDL